MALAGCVGLFGGCWLMVGFCVSHTESFVATIIEPEAGLVK